MPLLNRPLLSEARGLLVQQGQHITPWGAMALIERDPTQASVVSHEDACRLWAGESVQIPESALIQTEYGAPLGVSDSAGERLRLPSRLMRQGVV